MKNILATRYAGLNLRNPIIVGSSGLTNTAEKNKNIEKAGAGAIVLKSLFEEQITMQADWMLKKTDFPEANDYIRNYVKENQLSDYIHLIRETNQACDIPVIASICCNKADCWIDFSLQIEAAGASALELNLLGLQSEVEGNDSEVELFYTNIICKLKKHITIPIIVKIGKNYNNIVNLANKFYTNGASAIVLFNRYYQPDIDINKIQMVSGQVFSSHSDIADTIRWTGIISGKVPSISLAASTGIHDWEDVIKCILAGSSAVQLCSIIYQNGLEIIPQMLNALEEWMISKEFFCIDDFKGKINTSNAMDPSIYERTQFMKYFSNRD